ESTTPTSFKMGSNSGVLSKDLRASFVMLVISSTTSINDEDSFAISAESLTTVKIVPSTGFVTASYANVTPFEKASANSSELTDSLLDSPIENPRNICDKITPEFPLAPISKPFEKAAATSDILSLLT